MNKDIQNQDSINYGTGPAAETSKIFDDLSSKITVFDNKSGEKEAIFAILDQHPEFLKCDSDYPSFLTDVYRNKKSLSVHMQYISPFKVAHNINGTYNLIKEIHEKYKKPLFLDARYGGRAEQNWGFSVLSYAIIRKNDSLIKEILTINDFDVNSGDPIIIAALMKNYYAVEKIASHPKFNQNSLLIRNIENCKKNIKKIAEKNVVSDFDNTFVNNTVKEFFDRSGFNDKKLKEAFEKGTKALLQGPSNANKVTNSEVQLKQQAKTLKVDLGEIVDTEEKQEQPQVVSSKLETQDFKLDLGEIVDTEEKQEQPQVVSPKPETRKETVNEANNSRQSTNSNNKSKPPEAKRNILVRLALALFSAIKYVISVIFYPITFVVNYLFYSRENNSFNKPSRNQQENVSQEHSSEPSNTHQQTLNERFKSEKGNQRE